MTQIPILILDESVSARHYRPIFLIHRTLNTCMDISLFHDSHFKWTLQEIKLIQAPLLMNILNLLLKVAHIPTLTSLLAFTEQVHS